MRVRISDLDALGRVQARTLRIYLAAHGWRRTSEDLRSTWTIGEGAQEFEVLPPSTDHVPDFTNRIAETIRSISAVEGRSELEVLRDLFQSRYDVQRHRLDYDGPSGTAPLADAGAALKSAQGALIAAASSLSFPERQIFPPRASGEIADLGHRALAGPISEGSFVFTVWVPVPPRLVPEEDLVLFEIEDEPFERAATLRLHQAMTSLSQAVRQVEDDHAGIEAFTDRLSDGVTAVLCEAVATMVNESRIGLETSFSWALDRPVADRNQPVVFGRGSQEVLQEAARHIRSLIPEEEIVLAGNVVRLHRDARDGTGEVTIAGVFAGDPDERLRRVTMTLPGAVYDEAIRAHDEFDLVEVVGELYRRGNRLYLRNPRDFLRIER